MSTEWNWNRIFESSTSELNQLMEYMSPEQRDQFRKEYKRVRFSESTSDYPNVGQLEPDEEGQEKLEPRAPAEKAWADKHTVQVFDRPDEDRQDNAEEMDRSAFPTAPTAVAKPEAQPSFDRIRRMMSQ